MSAGLFSVDLMTLLRLCALTALLFGIGMLLAAAGIRRYRAVLAHIGAANLLFVVAMLLAAERGGIPTFLGDIIPALCVVAGITIWHRGTAILLGLRQLPGTSAIAMTLVLLTMLATDFPNGDPRPGSAVFFGAVAWLMLYHAWQIYDALRPMIGRILRLAIIAPKLVFGGFALVRVVALFMLPAAGGLVFVNQASALNTILFLVVFLNLVGLNVGFALLMGLSLEQTTEKLHYQSRHDLLTDLFNRRALLELLEREIARQRRGTPAFSVLMIDLDRFKQFNDRYGHLVGDAALIHVADTLRRTARTQDVVARFGGEEFCLVLPDTDAEAAMQAGERLRLALLAAPFRRSDAGEESITISVGVAAHEVAAEPWERLLGRADDALYAAKDAGRNTVMRAPAPEPETVSPAESAAAGR